MWKDSGFQKALVFFRKFSDDLCLEASRFFKKRMYGSRFPKKFPDSENQITDMRLLFDFSPLEISNM
jgi:hypothetical protein